jgi:TetR/AcrR family transcriptional regulator, transcriptional repressor of bet genes
VREEKGVLVFVSVQISTPASRGCKLDYLSEEHRENWSTAMLSAGLMPEQRLAALIEADFKPELCRPNRLAAWCAYWGESQS